MDLQTWKQLNASWEHSAKTQQITEQAINALMESIAQNDWRATSRLLQKGCSPNLSQGMRTPLMCAAENGAIECLKLLIQTGATVGAQDELGRDALFCSIEAFQDAALHHLLKQSPRLKRLFEDNRTPLIIAAQISNLPAVRMLVNYDKNCVNQYDRTGRTALWYVLSKPELSDDDNEIARILMDAGADPQMPDINGITPAQASADPAAQSLLERADLAQAIDQHLEESPQMEPPESTPTPKKGMRL